MRCLRSKIQKLVRKRARAHVRPKPDTRLQTNIECTSDGRASFSSHCGARQVAAGRRPAAHGGPESRCAGVHARAVAANFFFFFSRSPISRLALLLARDRGRLELCGRARFRVGVRRRVAGSSRVGAFGAPACSALASDRLCVSALLFCALCAAALAALAVCVRVSAVRCVRVLCCTDAIA